MKKSIVLLGLVALIVSINSCASPGQGNSSVSAEGADPKASYAFGLSVGQGLKETGVAIDYNELLKGVRAGMVDNFETMSMDDATAAIETAISSAEAAKYADKIKSEADFLAENAKKEGIQVTDSGIQYLVTKVGTGAAPGPYDAVVIHYEGRFTNGEVFDSSKARNEPAEIPLDGVIPGWAEAVQLMKVGGAQTVWIPADLAYGAEGAGEVIEPYSTLVFDLELLEIQDQ